MTVNKNTLLKQMVLKHPILAVLALVVIAYSGYLFGQWLYQALH